MLKGFISVLQPIGYIHRQATSALMESFQAGNRELSRQCRVCSKDRGGVEEEVFIAVQYTKKKKKKKEKEKKRKSRKGRQLQIMKTTIITDKLK